MIIQGIISEEQWAKMSKNVFSQEITESLNSDNQLEEPDVDLEELEMDEEL